MPIVALLALLGLGGYLLMRGAGAAKVYTTGKSGIRYFTRVDHIEGSFSFVDVGVEANALLSKYGAHPEGLILQYRQTGSDKSSRLFIRKYQGPEGSSIKWPGELLTTTIRDFAIGGRVTA